MDYRATLNLPQTSFKMKANLSQKEPMVLKQWEKENLYEDRRDVASQLFDQLSSDVRSGRSTTGPTSANDVENIVLWKSERRERNTGANRR